MSIVLRLLLVFIGVLITYVWVRTRQRRLLLEYRTKAAAIAERTALEVDVTRTDVGERASVLREHLSQSLAEYEASEQAQLGDYEAVLVDRESLLVGRERTITEHEAQLELGEKTLRTLERQVEAVHTEALALRNQRVPALERKCGESVAETLARRVSEIISKAELGVLVRLRDLEARLNENASPESRRIMRIAMERYDGQSHLERVVNSIALAPRILAAFVDPSGPCRAAFLEEVGCDLVIDEAQFLATVHGDDPLAREVARRVLRQLDGLREVTAEPLRSLCRQMSMEVERDVQSAGRKALRALGLGRTHADVSHLVGRLKFRLSYSQNQLRHSIEVGQLAGLMAAELGLDVMTARRGGLLHDIGKAMTHDHEGSHATLGAEVARRCGEDDIVVNAIASHHNDEPPRSPIALIVTAADALSGGRPGARRESATQYLGRIQEIQRIAGRSLAVKRVDIMQAGREVRVVVAGAEHGAIDPNEMHRGPSLVDAELQPLAQAIARTIEDELIFAGQIKVTVIRESRAVSIAR